MEANSRGEREGEGELEILMALRWGLGRGVKGTWKEALSLFIEQGRQISSWLDLLQATAVHKSSLISPDKIDFRFLCFAA